MGGAKDRRQFKRKKVLPLSLHIQHIHMLHVCTYAYFSQTVSFYINIGFFIYHEHFLILLKNALKYYLKYYIPMVWAPKSLQMVIATMKLKDAYSLEGKL